MSDPGPCQIQNNTAPSYRSSGSPSWLWVRGVLQNEQSLKSIRQTRWLLYWCLTVKISSRHSMFSRHFQLSRRTASGKHHLPNKNDPSRILARATKRSWRTICKLCFWCIRKCLLRTRRGHYCWIEWSCQGLSSFIAFSQQLCCHS